jgi:K(+)-stimulated pyrophosphate-energized sodium pump
MVPVVFSALAMNAVGKAAMEMVYEVRRQFKEIPGIMEGTGKPEYDKCVEISTNASLKEMMLPGILTIGFPLIITFIPMLFGMDNLMIAEMLGGYMAGVTVSGVLWAIFQNNAGGAWDNAKKSFEAGVIINGEMTHKGSAAHEAAITGDTVGDPFKDTSGPSMNILIKLTCLIGLVIAPILGGSHENTKEEDNTNIIEINDGGIVEKGLMSSNVSSAMESIAISYAFDRKTKTVTEITIKDIHCRGELYECTEVLKLANKQNIIFKSTERAVDNKNNEFNKQVSGELHFADSKMDATLLFHIRGNNEGGSKLLGSIILSSDNFKKSSSDITIYVKGKSK